nr:hypothetical protein [Nannocystis sp.]
MTPKVSVVVVDQAEDLARDHLGLDRARLAATAALTRPKAAGDVDPRSHARPACLDVAGQTVRELAGAARALDLTVVVDLVELAADESAELGVHPVLGIEGHSAADAVALLELSQDDPQALEEARLYRLERLRSNGTLLYAFGELPLNVRLEEVRELAVIADEYDATLGHAERDEEVERVSPCCLVDDHGLEGRLAIFNAADATHLLPRGLLEGGREDDGVILEGLAHTVGIGLEIVDIRGDRRVVPNTGSRESTVNGVEDVEQEASRVLVEARLGNCCGPGQPIDQRVAVGPSLGEPWGYRLGFDSGAPLEKGAFGRGEHRVEPP